MNIRNPIPQKYEMIPHIDPDYMSCCTLLACIHYVGHAELLPSTTYFRNSVDSNIKLQTFTYNPLPLNIQPAPTPPTLSSIKEWNPKP